MLAGVLVAALLLSLSIGCDPPPAEPAHLSGNPAPDTAADSGEPPDTAADTATGDSGVPSGPEWTILVYMNGDNDLEPWALSDINEMEQVGSTAQVNLVVQLDRSPDFAVDDGDWVGARRYLVQADSDKKSIGSPVLAELGDVDSGSSDTIAEFARWGLESFPAERVALVLWDHGTGWSFRGREPSKGISDDYTSRSELSVAGGDLVALLAAVTEGRSKLDLMGFDACTMQMWEVAWSVEPYAQVMVGSQDYEDLQGWAYDRWLADLVADPSMGAAELGSAIALRFHEIPDSTQSVLDLAALPALTSALDQVADSAIASGLAAELLWTAASGAQGFDGPYSYDHDVHDLLERLDAASEDAAVDAAIALALGHANSVVVASYNQGGRVKAAQGLSIFSPAEGYLPPIYAGAAWAAASRWDEFIAEAGKQ